MTRAIGRVNRRSTCQSNDLNNERHTTASGKREEVSNGGATDSSGIARGSRASKRPVCRCELNSGQIRFNTYCRLRHTSVLSAIVGSICWVEMPGAAGLIYNYCS